MKIYCNIFTYCRFTRDDEDDKLMANNAKSTNMKIPFNIIYFYLCVELATDENKVSFSKLAWSNWFWVLSSTHFQLWSYGLYVTVADKCNLRGNCNFQLDKIHTEVRLFKRSNNDKRFRWNEISYLLVSKFLKNIKLYIWKEGILWLELPSLKVIFCQN